MNTPIASQAWLKVLESLSENQARWLAAEKAMQIGRGGIRRVHDLTGLSKLTISKGIRELQDPNGLPPVERIRRPGGGRKKLDPADRPVIRELEQILAESTAGDPMSPLKWTVKSTRTISAELRRKRHRVSPSTVYRIVSELGYSLQANRKTSEGGDHPDRDAQFRHIAAEVKRHIKAGEPVISVDAKKREQIGNFKNAGRTYKKKGHPTPVNVYDFRRLATGVATLYGMYDQQHNQGMVNVGVSHDTAEYAVESIRQWWRRFGRRHYPNATSLLICADGGGSNSSRSNLWRLWLQRFCDSTGVSVTVCHYPPGTSKWNKIEHRMFSFISLNWRGIPLQNYETVISLIGHTTTRAGLKISARLDRHEYSTGLKATKADMESINLTGHAFHPQWNYTISPHEERVMA